MEKETLFGKYHGVEFYGIGQLSFVYWCVTNNVKIQNNKIGKVMKTKEGKTLKPIFFLPEYDLYMDVRSGKSPNKYRRKYEYQLRSDITKANDDFVYLLSEKIGNLDFMQARKLLLESDDAEISPQLEAKLNILQVSRKVNLDRISMPRWFRTQLADIRKAKAKAKENEFAVEA